MHRERTRAAMPPDTMITMIERDLLLLKWMVATTIGLLLLVLGKVW